LALVVDPASRAESEPGPVLQRREPIPEHESEPERVRASIATPFSLLDVPATRRRLPSSAVARQDLR
jgi:hypothetical protein